MIDNNNAKRIDYQTNESDILMHILYIITHYIDICNNKQM